MVKKRIAALFFICILFLVANTISSVRATETTLLSPEDGSIETNEVVNFVSKITDDANIVNATLYTNISGSWTTEETRWNLYSSSNIIDEPELSFLIHFNNQSEFGESGDFFLDFSNNGNNAICNNSYCPTLINNGKFEGAIEFNENLDNARILKSSTNQPQKFTYVWWAYPISGGSGGSWSRFFGREKFRFEIAIDATTGELKFYDGSWKSFNTNIPFEIWSHLAVSYNSTHTQLYVDGILASTIPGGRTLTGHQYIGSRYTWPRGAEVYRGYMDEVALYNTLLTSSQIFNLYNSTLTSYYPSFKTINNVSQSTYEWNVLAYDDENNFDFGDDNFTFTISTTSPEENETTDFGYYNASRVNQTQFDTSTPILNMLESWLTTFLDYWFETKVGENTTFFEGNVTVNGNITANSLTLNDIGENSVLFINPSGVVSGDSFGALGYNPSAKIFGVDGDVEITGNLDASTITGVDLLTLENLIASGSIEFIEQGDTPSNPIFSHRMLYTKSDGWYGLNGTGKETRILDEETLKGNYINGQAYVCVYDNGTLYVNETGCA